MVFNRKEEIITKTMAIVALATLIFMALSFIIVPNEGADSVFVLKLKADEPRIQYVDTAPGEFTVFDMELYSTNVNAFEHEISLQITDITYTGGSSAPHWTFEFQDPDSTDGASSIYHVDPDEIVDIGLKVTFLGTTGGEMVTFTITGKEDSQNDTRLSPVGGEATYFDFLSVVSNAPYNPYIEPSPESRTVIQLPDEGSFSLTMWNLGSEEDEVFISGVGAWQDNGDGVFSPEAGRAGEDIKNNHIELEFTTKSGAPYNVNDKITLSTGASEEINGLIVAPRDNDLVPVGNYFIQITVNSENGEPESTLLTAHMPPVMRPDFTALKLEVDDNDLEEGDTVTIHATIGIDWDQDGEVTYAFYIDDELIEGSTGSVTFTHNDNTKVVSYEWKTKTGDSDTRVIKVVVDPDDVKRETNEDNNEKTATITVTEEEAKFPIWILALVIGAVVVAVGAYWVYAGGPSGNLTIDDIIIRPDPPKVGDPAEIVAVLKNAGGTFEVEDKRSIVVSFYEDYESIGERPVDLSTESFEGGSTREVTLSWEPAAAGLHNLNVAVDIDDEESDVSSKDIEIGE